MAQKDNPGASRIKALVNDAFRENSGGGTGEDFEDTGAGQESPQPLSMLDIPRAPESANPEPNIIEWCAQLGHSDTDNAYRLISHVGVDLVVMAQEKAKDAFWGVWTGTHWDFGTGRMRALALAQHLGDRIKMESFFLKMTKHETAILDAAAEALDKAPGERTEADKEKVKAANEVREAFKGRAGARVKFGNSSKNANKLEAMLKCAAPHLLRVPDDFNANHFKVAVAGHTLSFKVGSEKELNPAWEREDCPPDAPQYITVQRAKCVATKGHKREDLITEVIPTAYKAGAKCPRWDAFLAEFVPDPAVRRLVQVAFGLGLLGVTVQKLFFHYGEGANGKSVAMEVIVRILGGNAVTLPAESFIGTGGQGGGATPDIARLTGRRLLRVTEIPQGEDLREDLVKRLTGGEKMAVRDLFSGYFDFMPIFTPHMSGNGYPKITGMDNGIWRRMAVIKWPITIPADKQRNFEDVVGEFEPEHSGILNWLIEGALIYLREGLVIPEGVTKETQKFRDEMDLTAAFCLQCVRKKEGAHVAARELYHSYVAWAEASAVKPISETLFGRIMSKKFTREDGSVRRYMNVEVVDVPPRVTTRDYPEGYQG